MRWIRKSLENGNLIIFNIKMKRIVCISDTHIMEIKPKIHIFGHVNGGYGYHFNGKTHFINPSQLNEQYKKVK